MYVHALATVATLRSRGVRYGDRVALLSENRPEWGIAYLAIASMGAVVVPVMTEFPAAQIPEYRRAMLDCLGHDLPRDRLRSEASSQDWRSFR